MKIYQRIHQKNRRFINARENAAWATPMNLKNYCVFSLTSLHICTCVGECVSWYLDRAEMRGYCTLFLFLRLTDGQNLLFVALAIVLQSRQVLCRYRNNPVSYPYTHTYTHLIFEVYGFCTKRLLTESYSIFLVFFF